MRLFIDTVSENTIIKITKGNRIIAQKKWLSKQKQTEELLSEIEKLLDESKITKTMLTAISVNPGPGSYTGQRVGVTTANFLAFSLNIPVTSGVESSGGKFIVPVEPIYQNKPFITRPNSG